MKTHLLLLLAAGLCVAGLPLRAGEGPVKPVLSGARGGETPVTALITPTSSLSPGVARIAAANLAALVPGTEILMVLPTGSMRPAFDDNTVLLSEPAPFGKLQIGDIVVFHHRGSGARVVHRIIERRDGGYWTKGDRSARMDDELVTKENYIGRVYGILYASRGGAQPLPERLRENEAFVTAAR